MELRHYQIEAVSKIRNKFAKGIKRVLYQLVTGGGKTVIFTFISQLTNKKNKRVLIVSHRIELLLQAGGTLQNFNLSPFYITQATKKPLDSNLYVAMIKTLLNRLKSPLWQEWFKTIDLLIIDEAHRGEFSKLHSDCYKLGVTATPKRTGKMAQLSSEYDSLICGLDIQELINEGFSVYDRYFGVDVDISGVGYDSKGEYNNSQLFSKYNKTELYSGVVDNWKRICPNTKTIVFCVNIQHCVETAKAFNNIGVKAKFLTSNVSKPKLGTGKAAEKIYQKKLNEYNNFLEGYKLYSGKRDDILSQHKNGEFNVLINAGIFVEGYDDKSVQCIVINLATTSVNKWLQMIGRGSRIFPEKEFFYLLDFGLNADRLGHYRQQREWSLSHIESKGEGVPPSKECPKCKALVFASATICKYCGYEFPKSKEEKMADLVEKVYASIPPQRLNFSKMSIDEIEEYAKQRGYKKNFIARKIFHAHGKTGLKKYANKKGYHHDWFYQQFNIFVKSKVI